MMVLVVMIIGPVESQCVRALRSETVEACRLLKGYGCGAFQEYASFEGCGWCVQAL